MSYKRMKAKKFAKSMAVGVTSTALVIGGLGVVAPAANAEVSKPGSYLTKEQVKAPATLTSSDGRVDFQFSVVADGSGHGTTSQSKITEANGFRLGDEKPQDGVVSIGDNITYNVSYNVRQSDKATKTRVVFDPGLQTVDGKPLDKATTGGKVNDGTLSINTDQWRTFCTGGTGYQHTGTSLSLDNGRMACDMTFQPTNGTASTDAGNFNVRVNNYGTGLTDALANPEFTVDGNSKRLPNPTRIVGALLIDPALRRVKNGQEFEDDKVYYTSQVVVAFPGDNNTKGGITPHPSFKIRATGKIVVDNLPEGSIIETSDPAMKVSGNTITFDNMQVNQRALGWNTTGWENIFPTFTVKVPGEAVGNEGVDFDAHISEMKVQRDSDTWYSDQLESNPNVLAPGGIYNPTEEGGFYEPGLGKDKDFDVTKNKIGGVSKSQDYKNNDWARIVIDPIKIGEWYKELLNDDNGKPGDTLIEGDKAEGNAVHPAGTSYWATFGAKPYGGTYAKPQYCDVWDSKYQSVDTSKNVIAKVWDGSSYRDAKYTIQYGHKDGAESLIGNESSKNADTKSSCAEDSGIQWSDTPSDDSNMMRIVFNEDVKATVAPTGYKGSVFYAQVPFKVRDKSAFPNWPIPTDLRDTAIFKSGADWSDERDTARTWISGSTLDPANWGGLNYTQNSGSTTKIIPDSKLRWIQYDTPGDTYSYTPELELDYGSAYSDISIPDSVLKNYEVLSIEKPDWGPDGLPGTDDDSGTWKVKLRAKKAITDNYYWRGADIDFNAYRDIQGTLPGYLQKGTEIPVTLRITNAGDAPGNVTYNDMGTGKITVNARSTVSQSKWTYTPREQVGNDISWGINWSNSSDRDQGAATFYDVLPYNGDSRGSKINGKLSNVRLDVVDTDSDVKVMATDADPKTITKAKVADGSIKFSDLASLNGNITAIKITEDKIQPDAKRLVKVTASTEGMSKDDQLNNNLGEGTVDSLGLPVPETQSVNTNLYTTSIGGTVFYDTNKDGKIGDGENKRYPDAKLTLYNEQGEEVATTESKDDGTYEFTNVPLGKYTVKITDRGTGTSTEWEITTGDTRGYTVTDARPNVTGLDFGFWSEKKSSIKVEKSVDGVKEGSTVEWHQDLKYRFKITNTGETTLKAGTKVTDSTISDIKCEVPELKPGESYTCEVTAPVEPTREGNLDDEDSPGEGFINLAGGADPKATELTIW